MSELKRGADIPVRHSELNGHSEDNGGLENPPSVSPLPHEIQRSSRFPLRKRGCGTGRFYVRRVWAWIPIASTL